MIKTVGVAALVTVLGSGLGAAERGAARRVDERRPASKDGRVSIESGSGTIRVIGWDREEVHVTGTLGPGPVSLDFESRDGHTDVSVESERHGPTAARADLEIRVPASSRLDIEGFASSIDVAGVSGSVSAEAVNGSIEVKASGGRIEASTVNGSVDVEAKGGRVSAESVNGSVSVRGSAQAIEASTVNGELSVDIDRANHVELETLSGSMSFTGIVADAGSLNAESVSGSVTLNFGAGQNATVDISTFSGSIECGSKASPEGRRPHRRRHEGRKTTEREVTIGSGSARVSVNTLSGSVKVTAPDLVIEHP